MDTPCPSATLRTARYLPGAVKVTALIPDLHALIGVSDYRPAGWRLVRR